VGGEEAAEERERRAENDGRSIERCILGVLLPSTLVGEERGSDAEVVQIRLPRLRIDISIMNPTIAIYNS